MTILREDFQPGRWWMHLNGSSTRIGGGSGKHRPGSGKPANLADGCESLDPTRLGHLAGVIESEIIPRLMMVHRTQPVAEAAVAGTLQTDITEADVVELTRLVLREEARASAAYCRQLGQRGVPPARILVDLLAPTARYLGELWESDETDFTSVTIALCRLQHVLHEVSEGAGFTASETSPERRVLLAPFPGEQHTFGMLMVSEFFARAGWEVAGDCALTAPELMHLAKSEWFEVIGVSVASEQSLADIADLVADLRQASRNSSVAVLVGGRMFSADPELAVRVGADGTALDAEGAVALAEAMLGRSAPAWNRV